jgi:hypothetical protein
MKVLAISAGYYVLWFVLSWHLVLVLVVVFVLGIVFLELYVSDFGFFDVAFPFQFSCSCVVLMLQCGTLTACLLGGYQLLLWSFFCVMG